VDNSYKRAVLFLSGLVLVSLFLSAQARAELYVAGEGGYTMPNNLEHVEGRGTQGGVQFSDLSLKNSYLYGARVGYFLAEPKEGGLGVEIEAYNTTPSVSQQTATRSSGGPLSVNGVRLRMTTAAVNLVARTPRFKEFQPYAGVGLGFFVSETSGTAATSTSNTAGLNTFVGLRYFFKERFALFGEYKYNRTSLHYENFLGPNAGIRATYSTNLFIGGLAYHF